VCHINETVYVQGPAVCHINETVRVHGPAVCHINGTVCVHIPDVCHINETVCIHRPAVCHINETVCVHGPAVCHIHETVCVQGPAVCHINVTVCVHGPVVCHITGIEQTCGPAPSEVHCFFKLIPKPPNQYTTANLAVSHSKLLFLKHNSIRNLTCGRQPVFRTFSMSRINTNDKVLGLFVQCSFEPGIRFTHLHNQNQSTQLSSYAWYCGKH
jgi:hypothetical protein